LRTVFPGFRMSLVFAYVEEEKTGSGRGFELRGMSFLTAHRLVWGPVERDLCDFCLLVLMRGEGFCSHWWLRNVGFLLFQWLCQRDGSIWQSCLISSCIWGGWSRAANQNETVVELELHVALAC
jgi:hypothetical protein